MTELVLNDLGERRILSEIIPEYVENVGDDCASLVVQGRYVQVTTDPVPRPAAEVIGRDPDPYWLGWLLVTINVSDVAASGSYPAGFLGALDLPGNYPVANLKRLLSGISDSCRANGIKFVGGNLREATTVSAVGTAFGSSNIPPLGRRGAASGDVVVYIGCGGRFWSDCYRSLAGQTIAKSESPLYSPVAQARAMAALHREGLIKCSMDTSDGFAPTLQELTRVNGLSIVVDLEEISKNSRDLFCIGRPERFWFGWGDWAVVAIASDDNVGRIEEVMKSLNAPYSIVGKCHSGEPKVLLSTTSNTIEAQRLESERFALDSWFTEGIEGYIRRLDEFPLP